MPVVCLSPLQRSQGQAGTDYEEVFTALAQGSGCLDHPLGQPPNSCRALKASHRRQQSHQREPWGHTRLPSCLALAESQSSPTPPWLYLHFTPLFVHSSSWQWLPCFSVAPGPYQDSGYRLSALPPALMLPCLLSPILPASASLTSKDWGSDFILSTTALFLYVISTKRVM